MTATAEVHMRRALQLAERGWGRVSPNPLVGAVVIRDGEVVGEGWHEGPGTDHAEVMALRAAGERARGSTVVCSLEPCHRFGRTPPCTRALIDAGVASVVVGATDPDLGPGTPGVAALREAGLAVEVGILHERARALNVAFERHVRTGLPYVVLKMASSLDGKTAAADGSSRWITGDAAREDVHRLRAWSDAILVGAGTVVADDPSLTVRGSHRQTASAAAPGRAGLDGAGLARRADPRRHRAFARGHDRSLGGAAHAGMGRCRCRGRRARFGRDGSRLARRPARCARQARCAGAPARGWSHPRVVGGPSGLDRSRGLSTSPRCWWEGLASPDGAGWRRIRADRAAARLGPLEVEMVGGDLRVVADVHGHR